MTAGLPQAIGTPTGGRPPWSASPEEAAAFVARHGTPYDAASDDYRDPGPFAQPVKAGKNSAIYNAHSYHTKVPPEGIVQYLEHYTRPRDLVLDPFCGSGMTGVACIMTGRHAVLNDLSPAATHIAYNYCTPVDLEAIKREWERIKGAVREEFAWLYGTTCQRCGDPATIQYTVWSDVFRCGRCRGEILLWDTAVVREFSARGYDPPLSSSARPGPDWKPATPETAPPKAGAAGREVRRTKGDVLDQFPCPCCGQHWRKTQLTLLRSEPVLTDAQCRRCRPKRHQYPTIQPEKDRIAEINAAQTPYWHPTFPFESTREMWRGVHRDAGITRVCDFWTKRNLWALARLWQEAGKTNERTAACLRFGVTSIFGRSSRTTRYLFRKAGNSSMTGTLYVGSFVTENNLLALAERKMQDVFPGLERVAATGPAATIVTQHAGQDLPLPADSVDYIFTDPPFGANIFYSDVNLLWEAWLGYLTDEAFDAVWNKSKKPEQGGKTLEDYRRLMLEAFCEMRRVLKPGRWASVVFHNSDDKVWDAIRESVEAAGFTIEDAQAFDKQQKSFKGVRGEKGLERVSNLDIVLNLWKPVEAGHPAPPLNHEPAETKGTPGPAPAGHAPSQDVVESVAQRVEDYLRSLATVQPVANNRSGGQDPRGVQAVHSNVIKLLINGGHPTTGVSFAQVEKVLRDFFKEVDGRWYLLGEEVGSTGAVDPREAISTGDAWTSALGSPKDEASTIEWVRARIRIRGPQRQGDLIDQFRLAAPTLKLAKDFRQVLEENFTYEQRRGRWRLPTAPEVEAKLSVKVRLLERRVQEVLDRSVPSPDADGLGRLLEDCYAEGLYQEAEGLWRMINPDHLSPDRRRVLAGKARVSRLRARPEVHHA